MSIYLSFYEKLKLIVVGMNGSVQTDNAYIREVTDVTTLMTVMMYQMRKTASVTISLRKFLQVCIFAKHINL